MSMIRLLSALATSAMAAAYQGSSTETHARSISVEADARDSLQGGMLRRELQDEYYKILKPVKHSQHSPDSKTANNNVKSYDFKHYDKNGSGKLEKKEAEEVMKDIGAKPDGWKLFDKDADGAISEKEFDAGAKAFHNKYGTDPKHIPQVHRPASRGSSLAELRARDHEVFTKYDADGNGKIQEGPETDAIMDNLGDKVGHAHFDWAFDKDKDRALDFGEFREMGKRASLVGKQSLSKVLLDDSLAETGDLDQHPNDLEADLHQNDLPTDPAVKDGLHRLTRVTMTSLSEMSRSDKFKAFDTDNSGFLERGEIKAALHKFGAAPGFSWRRLDRNEDNKISKKEFKKAFDEEGNIAF